MIVRKIKNISEHSIPIKIDENITIFISAGQELVNTKILNLGDIKSLVKVEYDLSEVNPINEANNNNKRVKLYD